MVNVYWQVIKKQMHDVKNNMNRSLSVIVSTYLLCAVLLTAQPVNAHIIELPEQLGDIVFHSNAVGASRVYIIANSHRSAYSGRNGENTLQAQIETYRIGEWLINNAQVELLLPEGFFGGRGKAGSGKSKSIDCVELNKRLADSTTFVNAELLLYENFDIGLQQVEDQPLYQHIRDQLRLAQQPRNLLSERFARDLETLQKRRTAVILENIPQAFEAAVQQAETAAPAAMLTIGLAHLDDLVRFLESGKIDVDQLHTFPALQNELKVLKGNICVTVIVPRSLTKKRMPAAPNNV